MITKIKVTIQEDGEDVELMLVHETQDLDREQVEKMCADLWEEHLGGNVIDDEA
jgi:hypothetical protein